MLEVVRKANLKVLFQDQIDYEDFSKMIDFIRKYADTHHHGKEEKLLFNRMVSEIGGAAEKLVNNGMLVEHDMGRFFIQELEQALEKVKSGDNEAKLDVIANSMGYANLLNRHIDKEDKVVYTFAKRALSTETMKEIDKQCEDFEKEMTGQRDPEKVYNALRRAGK